MELHQPELHDHEDPSSLTRIYTVLKKFNRNTTWVATGLLGSVIFAALMVALQDRQPKSDYLTTNAKQGTGDFSPSTEAAAITDLAPKEKSTAQIVSEQPTSLDRGLTLAVVQSDVRSDVNSLPEVSGKDSARVVHEKVRHVRLRSSVHQRYGEVQARLIALWHQCLQREKSPGWTLSSNSNEWRKKKISYTAATNH
jgi:hypothetical protein